MVLNTKIIQTKTYDPWWNLAVEEYLLDRVQKGQCILYLWQNDNTVVIGKNQNPWKECRTEQLEREGGKLARRLSGGGAVYHDLGNLNFTFVVDRDEYSLERQVKVILTAARMVGINAEMTGRNDITVDGRKFSGNAFCFHKTSAYHHGTILVGSDMSKLTRYLQVSAEKIKSKGVESVRSRVINLSEIKPSLTIDEMSEAMKAAFIEVYGGNPSVTQDTADMDSAILKQLYDKYSSWDWRYGEAPRFDIELDTRFPWGNIEIGMQLEKGRVRKALVYSDAMDEEFVGMLPQVLEGLVFKSSELAGAVRAMNAGNERCQFVHDIAEWLEGKNF